MIELLIETTKKVPISQHFQMVEGDGFEPSKQEATDLQSAPFGHSGTPPYLIFVTKSCNLDIKTHSLNFVNTFFEIFLKFLKGCFLTLQNSPLKRQIHVVGNQNIKQRIDKC